MQLELKQYIRIIIKRIWIVITIPIIAAMISAFVVLFLIEPEYEAGITLYVMIKGTNTEVPVEYEDIMISEQLVKDYRELIRSKSVTKGIISRLNITDISSNELANKISVDLKKDTRILEIKVKDQDAERAKILADAAGVVFIEKVEELMESVKIEVVDEAEIPEKPNEPKLIIFISAAILAGLLFAICLIFLMEYMNDTIRTVEDVEKNLGLTVLGTIPTMDIK